MGIEDYSTTAASNNSAVPNGWPEGMAPSGVNDTGRQIMADTRTWYQDAQWIDLGNTPTFVSTTSFTLVGDLTATYEVGRRLKMFGTTPFTLFGTILTSVFSSPNTTITMTMDSGSLDATLSIVSTGILSATSSALPTGTLAGLTSNNAFTGANTFASTTALNGDTTFTAAILTPDDGELTISSGVITVTGNYHTVDTEADAATDDLDTINTTGDGKRITLRIENDARDVVIKNGTGNISTPDGNDITLGNDEEVISLIFDTALSKWLVTAQPKQAAVTSITPTIQTFPSTATWNRPAGCTKIKVITTAAGASGADAATGSAHGGGSGATVIEFIDVTSISSVSIVIGIGGAASAGNGNDGGSSNFGTHHTVTGGKAGTSSVAGDGGTVTIGGDIDIPGYPGFRGTGVASGSSYTGQGAPSYWGPGGKAVTSGNGNIGAIFGAGGSGSISGNTSGAGANGHCSVEEYYP